MPSRSLASLLAPAGAVLSLAAAGQTPLAPVEKPEGGAWVLQAGHPSLQAWLLPRPAPAPADNAATAERVELGRQLFFDPRISMTGQVSCVSCHLPDRGWGDGFPRSVRFMGEVMARNSPSIVNSAFNRLLMWDGRNATLEHQVVGSLAATGSQNAGARELGLTDSDAGIKRIRGIAGYRAAFAEAYPGEEIGKATIAKAIAAFERSMVSDDTPFDRWVRGDAAAMNDEQLRGLRLFLDAGKGNCVVCHAPPTFSDNGFHNIGVAQFGRADADVGRFKEQPLLPMKGAFRTTPLREVVHTAPYFHDGSAANLAEVVEHYARGGAVKSNLSPHMKPLALSAEERAQLVEFLRALSTPYKPYEAPRLFVQ